jgi:hypothetical protein
MPALIMITDPRSTNGQPPSQPGRSPRRGSVTDHVESAHGSLIVLTRLIARSAARSWLTATSAVDDNLVSGIRGADRG